MKNSLFIVFLIVFSLGSVSAQTFKPILTKSSAESHLKVVSDTLNILAIMVNFQEDRDGATFGNGKFGTIYTQNYGTGILDPLPHDKQYFEDHLTFVKNYFAKVSNGKLIVQFTVLPDTFSVSQTMRNYSPDPGSEDLTKVGNFAKEAWTLADQMYPGFNFSDFDLFTIFHAGVGRDVTLPGSIGNERDLPSVYLSEKTFKEIFGNSFEGIPVSGGTFRIQNSMVMPETESRELNTIVGSTLFQLTINGLLAASVGSHLGLPDLFNTVTGLSAIGRFGLMDGQGIFAFGGTYPPEPSPWSKVFMGWAEPVIVDLGSSNINLVTKLAAQQNDTVLIKIPLNSSEYYLIENRNRDALKDGSKVTYKVNGTTITKIFRNDTTGYQSFDVDSLEGVIIDVDEFDWAVPGSGIVIWHIDDNIINEKIDDNTINNDKNHKGVDVEEADGIQDIGEIFRNIFGDEVIGEGTKFDLWYSSNPSELFQNKFAKDTRPDTRTNAGANSLITIKDFSDISNRMNFKIEYGDSLVKPLFSKQMALDRNFSTDISVLGDNSEASGFCLHNGDMIKITDLSGVAAEDVSNFSRFKPAVVFTNQIQYIVGAINSVINIYVNNGTTSLVGSADAGVELTSPPVIRTKSNGDVDILVGTADGKILNYSISSDGVPVLINTITTSSEKSIVQLAVNDEYWAAVTSINANEISDFVDVNGAKLSFSKEQFSFLLTKDSDGNYVSILFSPDRSVFIKQGDIIAEREISVDQTNLVLPALGDIKQDGINYLAYPNGFDLIALNFSGYPADNFPTQKVQEEYAGLTLSGDFSGSSNSELLTTSTNGSIAAVDGGTGKVVDEFPIAGGGTNVSSMVLYTIGGKASLAAIDDNKFFRAWNIALTAGNLQWREKYSNGQNTSFIKAAEKTNFVNDFFPENRAYNYPNPVYEGTTNIRYYVSEDANINIKVFDLAGDFVAELNDVAQGGVDNETVWDVSGIQSGVYFARIEASANDGKSEFAIIKIAVVK